VTSPAFPPPRRAGAIVLVHGAWVGEWCWFPILPVLEASGRMVRAVSLRGHGLRSNESGPHITLDDHVHDVVDLVEMFDLDAITLVGHSYGGRVITRAWPLLADRVDRMIYLDAHAPLGEAAIRHATGHLVDMDGMVPFARFAPDPDEFGGREAVEWFMSRIRPQSAATLAPPFAVDLPDELDTTYVAAIGERDSPFAGYAAAARVAPNWRYAELDCSHWVMVARPTEVAAVILDPADGTERRSVHRTTRDSR
jgi:pimeloyl-ACP methyl ester carboxylesterase